MSMLPIPCAACWHYSHMGVACLHADCDCDSHGSYRRPHKAAASPLPEPPAAPTADPTFLQRLNDDDLEALGQEWAERCDPCDDGGPGYCSCPPDKARDVIARLVAEVQRLRIIEAAQLPVPKETGRWQR